MKHRLITIISLLLAINHALWASEIETATDSIRRILPSLAGEELLQAHSNLCRLASASDNEKDELACLRDYIAEAHRQGNAEAEGQARSMQIMSFYNYNLSDSLKNALTPSLRFMKANGLWDHYYNSWNTLVELYIYEDKLQTALAEAKKMYDDAKENNSNYGLGVSAYCMGGIYQTMQRFEQASIKLGESINHLKKEEDISLLLSAYNALAESLDATGNYAQLRTTASQWREVIDNYRIKAEAKGYTPALGGRYLYCTLAAALAEIETGNNDKAKSLLAEAKKLAEGRKSISQFKYMQVLSRYYAATHQYGEAIDCNRKNIELLASAGDSVSMLTVEQLQAQLMLKNGQYEEAALLFNSILPRKDRLRTGELATQLDELSTIYEVDRLMLKNQIANNRLIFAAILCLMLLVITFLFIRHNRQLRKKNRALYDAINSAGILKDDVHQTNDEESPDTNQTLELYNRICKLMKEQMAFKDPALKREDVAQTLGSNRTYVAEAIRQYANGMTFTEFLNRYRLRHSAILLSENHMMPINAAADESGFNSRSTFNRLFRDYYGMSPSEYKEISNEKQLLLNKKAG